MVTLENINKSYGNLHILKNINLSIQASEIVSITGASGAGKSTLLHIMGTLDNADTGNYLVNGKDVLKLNATEIAQFRNRHIGFIFQFHHLLPEFSALENVCMPALIAGKKMKEAKERAHFLLSKLKLAHRIEHKPAALSGGEQQRVAIARALINEPTLVLADEPSGNLDSKHSMELMDYIFSLREELKQTFVLVTHDKEMAKEADRIVQLKDGEIVNE